MTVLRQILLDYLEVAIPKYQESMHSNYNTLKVREYKSRWGSFSSKGVLAFNTLLVGAPKSVVDYVVVHELAHFHVMAHNLRFWNLVTQFYGDGYQSARDYLKQCGDKLMIEKE